MHDSRATKKQKMQNSKRSIGQKRRWQKYQANGGTSNKSTNRSAGQLKRWKLYRKEKARAAKRAAMQDQSSIGTSERWAIYEKEKKRAAKRAAFEEETDGSSSGSISALSDPIFSCANDASCSDSTKSNSDTTTEEKALNQARVQKF